MNAFDSDTFSKFSFSKLSPFGCDNTLLSFLVFHHVLNEFENPSEKASLIYDMNIEDLTTPSRDPDLSWSVQGKTAVRNGWSRRPSEAQ